MVACDAVLLIAFGGPNSMAEVRPFLANVLRGRAVPPERIETVVHHYELIGGRSPLTELTQRQAGALRAVLARAGPRLPVYVGMRNWHPLLAETLAEMQRDGVRRAVGMILAAQQNDAGWGRYQRDVAAARAPRRSSAGGDLRPQLARAPAVHRSSRRARARRPRRLAARAALRRATHLHRAQHSGGHGGGLAL